ncbi:hypothetical protein TNCT_129411 [Trichonephila clavata]|uniref:Uncharacterized protein n=1 Tax=Trichonephila clavata TaxID=2740835 RepID=A0A8X6GWV7_TRICU|nr:hypothetical protein TNCT_129411 [Trichonephila clavata]
MRDFINFEETPEIVTNEIVSLMNELNLDITIEDINELIKSHPTLLLNEYLFEQQLSNDEIHNESEEEKASKNVRTLKIKNLNEAFMHFYKLLTLMEGCDLTGDIIFKVLRVVERGTSCYKSLYQEKKPKGERIFSTNLTSMQRKHPKALKPSSLTSLCIHIDG